MFNDPKVFIYLLQDPRPGKEFKCYIGKSYRPDFRLKHGHLKEKGTSYKVKWINKLKTLNLTPELVILDEVLQSEWQFWEKYWITQFKAWGFSLVNGTNGGDGGPILRGEQHPNFGKPGHMKGKHHTQITKDLLSINTSFRRPEVKELARLSHVGKDGWSKGLTKETDSRIKNLSKSKKGMTFSSETKLVWSEVKKKPILQLDNYGNIINKFPSIKDTMSFFKVKGNSSLIIALKNKTQYKNSYWTYELKEVINGL